MMEATFLFLYSASVSLVIRRTSHWNIVRTWLTWVMCVCVCVCTIVTFLFSSSFHKVIKHYIWWKAQCTQGHNVSLITGRRIIPLLCIPFSLAPFCRLILVMCHIFSDSRGISWEKYRLYKQFQTPWIWFGIPVSSVTAGSHLLNIYF